MANPAVPIQPANPRLDAVKQRLTVLPVLPGVLVQLLRLHPSSDEYFDDVVTLVQRDPTYASRVLSYAGSAAFATAHPVRRVREAVARIGAQTAVRLVTAAEVARIFVPHDVHSRALWGHSMQVAELSRALSILTRVADPDELYLGGLLHDLGRFVLLSEASEVFHASAQASPEALLAAEQRKCGFTHAELGFEASLVWHLPPALGVLIRDHHVGGRGLKRAPVNALDLIQCADWVSYAVGSQDAWLDMDDAALRKRIGSRIIHESFYGDAVLFAVRGAFSNARAALLSLGISLREP